MNKMLVACLAIVMLAAGVLTIGTAAVLMNRSAGVGSPPAVNSETVFYEIPESAKADWLKEFTLLERSGDLIDSQDLAGQVHVVSFFFSKCPSVCWLQNQRVADLAKQFTPEGAKFVSITCDPENDTPAVLRQYADSLAADKENWLFLTGDSNYIQRVGAEMYMVPVANQTHSEQLIVVDKWGEVRGRYHFNKPAEVEELKDLVKTLLAEEEPPAKD